MIQQTYCYLLTSITFIITVSANISLRYNNKTLANKTKNTPTYNKAVLINNKRTNKLFRRTRFTNLQFTKENVLMLTKSRKSITVWKGMQSVYPT